AGEAELGHRGAPVVADAPLVVEEFLAHHRADGVTPHVFGPRGAAPVPVEAGKRVSSTWLELAAEHISVAHLSSIDSAGLGPQDSAADQCPRVTPTSRAGGRHSQHERGN